MSYSPKLQSIIEALEAEVQAGSLVLDLPEGVAPDESETALRSMIPDIAYIALLAIYHHEDTTDD